MNFNPVVYSIKPKNRSMADEVLIFFDNVSKATKFGGLIKSAKSLIVETCFPEFTHQENEPTGPYYVLLAEQSKRLLMKISTSNC